jgi:hypothetical protein
MDLSESVAQILEIDVRTVTSAKNAQVAGSSRHLRHQAATMVRVPFGRVWRAAVHVALRLADTMSRLQRN